MTGDCFKGDRISIMERIFHSLFSFFGGFLTSMRTIFHILNFLLGFEAWRNKRKKLILRTSSELYISFVLFPQASEPSKYEMDSCKECFSTRKL